MEWMWFEIWVSGMVVWMGKVGIEKWSGGAAVGSVRRWRGWCVGWGAVEGVGDGVCDEGVLLYCGHVKSDGRISP